MFEATHEPGRREETRSPGRQGLPDEDARDVDLERASGAGRVVLAGEGTGARIADIYQKFPISLVFPKVDDHPCEKVVIINSSGGGSKAILVPLYNLVYHDAVIVSFTARDEKTLLQGLLFGGVPEMPIDQAAVSEKTKAFMRQMCALHKRVGMLEMTRHEFLGNNYRKERTTFADGTTVTVDWDSSSYKIEPELR